MLLPTIDIRYSWKNLATIKMAPTIIVGAILIIAKI